VSHPTHLIEIIEVEDYNEFGFKKYIGQKLKGDLQQAQTIFVYR
jgi:hypothetical protein